jgi:hypothetical protein
MIAPNGPDAVSSGNRLDDAPAGGGGEHYTVEPQLER